MRLSGNKCLKNRMDSAVSPKMPIPRPATRVSTAPLTEAGTLTRDWGHIKSFVHRKSRFTAGQKAAYDALLPVYGIRYQNALHDFSTDFARQAPLILEIGCGMGETTAAIAAAAPQINYLGVEVFNAGIGALLRRIEDHQLTNLRLMQHDAVEIVRDMLTPEALAGVHIYFPDPWTKARHHKRRLVQPWFVTLLAGRIATGGYIHCATDVQDYAEQMLQVLSGEPALKNTTHGYAARRNPLVERPVTKFEQRGVKLGHGVWDLVFTKR
jgi:tRNA (guanine-N7-)-methyltransferase